MSRLYQQFLRLKLFPESLKPNRMALFLKTTYVGFDCIPNLSWKQLGLSRQLRLLLLIWKKVKHQYNDYTVFRKS